MLIIDHRCLGQGHRENSVQALQTALRTPVDGVEIDIRLTKDLKWVVIHNPFFKSEERTVLRTHTMTHNQIKREVTLLDTMLALFAAHDGGKTIFIDVKDVGGERQLSRMIQKYGLHGSAVVIAWEPEVLRRVHAIDPEIRLGFSYIPVHSTMTFIRGTVHEPISKHKMIMRFNAEHSFDAKLSQGYTSQHYLATIPDLPLHSIQVPATLCSRKLVRRAHDKGMKVLPFVVNTKLVAAILRRRGADGILTNNPKIFLKETLKEAR